MLNRHAFIRSVFSGQKVVVILAFAIQIVFIIIAGIHKEEDGNADLNQKGYQRKEQSLTKYTEIGVT